MLQQVLVVVCHASQPTIMQLQPLSRYFSAIFLLTRNLAAMFKKAETVGVSPNHLRTETDAVSETLCFLIFRIPDDGQSPETQ
jgi:hypothetical protein